MGPTGQIPNKNMHTMIEKGKAEEDRGRPNRVIYILGELCGRMDHVRVSKKW